MTSELYYRCSSSLGMIGGRQIINIGRGCEVKGIVQHEIFHALGRIHEQSRADRDKYVRIHWKNIKTGINIRLIILIII